VLLAAAELEGSMAGTGLVDCRKDPKGCRIGLPLLGFAMAAPPPLRFDGGTEVKPLFVGVIYLLAVFARGKTAGVSTLARSWRHWLGRRFSSLFGRSVRGHSSLGLISAVFSRM
jgi:hypothetical protein